MESFIQRLFFLCFVQPLVTIVLGLHIRDHQRLPKSGPAIIVANHNSHLDTLVLMTIMPREALARIRPVAAADYFLKNKFLAWFSQTIMRVIPIDRSGAGKREDAFQAMAEALAQDEILILFPEGSRGEPEEMGRLKKGIAHLAQSFPTVPIVPVFMHGLGKALPKGEALLVPFVADIHVGEALRYCGDIDAFMNSIQESFVTLAAQCERVPWS